MFIVKYRNFFFILSGIMILFSFYAMFAKGFNFSIDFKSGSKIEVSYETVPTADAIKNTLDKSGFIDAEIQMAGTNDVIVKTRALTEPEHQTLSQLLSTVGTKMEEISFSSVGPTIGNELKSSAILSILMVILGIVLFIAYAFRHVSEPISSWKYGVVTTLSLFHDIIVPAGIFIWFGKEIDTLFVVALLTIMGVSVHDTIVVFDRIRENLRIGLSNDFFTTVGKSLEQTFTRSVNTSFTVMLVVAMLFFFGPASTKDFAFILWIGVFVGTYSSIFIASPLLVVWEKWQNKA